MNAFTSTGCLCSNPIKPSVRSPSALGLSEAVASQYLRVLEARGLLAVKRAGRSVRYRIGDAEKSHGAELAAAMRETFRREPEPVESIFKLATAFTHPRRIELFRLLQRQSRAAAPLRVAAKMSSWALSRHLRKLENRGFIARQGRTYAAVQHTHKLRASWHAWQRSSPEWRSTLSKVRSTR